MRVPFVDLHEQYVNHKSQIDNAIHSVIDQTSFVGGEFVKKFEQEFASLHSIRHCIGCGNGTDSLEILLRVFGIGPGHEVIVPAMSWISTSEAVSAMGAKPVFVDIEPDYFTMDTSRIEEKITRSTKAIIPVHLYGHPADMVRIMEIAKKHDLIVIEDCAQSHLAELNNKKTGTWGHASSFSFYPGKNLGAYGDAGCMLSQDDFIGQEARMIANHGQLKKHEHLREGRNSRLDSMQAAILSAKLPELDSWTKKRISRAALYSQLLSSTSILTPQTREHARHVFHLYVIRVNHREKTMQSLKEQGIETSIHYPKALPFLAAYKSFNHKEKDFPVASLIQNQILSLPMFPELSDTSIEYVVQHLKQLQN